MFIDITLGRSAARERHIAVLPSVLNCSQIAEKSEIGAKEKLVIGSCNGLYFRTVLKWLIKQCPFEMSNSDVFDSRSVEGQS